MRITFVNNLRADTNPSAITLFAKNRQQITIIHGNNLDIPTTGGCVVDVPTMAVGRFRHAVYAHVHYTTAPNQVETQISSIM